MDQKKPDDGDREENFSAEVKIVGINPYVDVPDHVVNAPGGGKVPVPVKVRNPGLTMELLRARDQGSGRA